MTGTGSGKHTAAFESGEGIRDDGKCFGVLDVAVKRVCCYMLAEIFRHLFVALCFTRSGFADPSYRKRTVNWVRR